MIRVGVSTSNRITIPAGLPQGSIFSPSLYSIHVSDLKFCAHTHFVCYADDTAIYASANRTSVICKKLEILLNTVQRFFDKWRNKANSVKTQAVIFPFNNRRIKKPTSDLVLNGTRIEYSNSATYMDEKLLFVEHIANLRNKANWATGSLYALIGRRSIQVDHQTDSDIRIDCMEVGSAL